MSTHSYHKPGATIEWATPQPIFDKLNEEFGFDVDVCANDTNAKCKMYLTKEQDGLTSPWYHKDEAERTFWMNPPYGRVIADWMKKAYEEAQKGATVVCLVPARTDTRWWHGYAMKGEIRFIKGRLKFGDSKSNAPFPSAVVIFRGKT